jgi:hypothetical protein
MGYGHYDVCLFYIELSSSSETAAKLKEGDRIRIMGGIHEGKTVIIKKINESRHRVDLEPFVPGNNFIADGLCEKIASSRVLVDELDEVEAPAWQGYVPTGELSSTSDEDEEEEESSEEGESSRFGEPLATRFLLDLLSQSIAMGPDITNSIEE